MADSPYPNIDPEVEAILKRIGSDPKSCLLKVSRPGGLGVLLDSASAIDANSTAIGIAERHLLQVHRNEVARLLREACKTKLVAGTWGRQNISRYDSTIREHKLWKRKDLLRQMNDVRRNATDNQGLDTPWILLERCVQAPFGVAPTVGQLAEASLRLEPNDEARILAGLDFIKSGAPRDALCLFNGILRTPTTVSLTVCTHVNLAMAYSHLKDMHMAYQHNIAACNAGEDRLEPWMNRLVYAIQLGFKDDARLAAESVDALAQGPLPAVVQFAEGMKDQITRAIWLPSGASHQVIRGLEGRLGVASGRIVSVFGDLSWDGLGVPNADESYLTGTGILPRRIPIKHVRLVV